MPTPPRDWMTPPSAFGTGDSAVAWKAATSPNQKVALRLAQIQHQVVYRTRVLMALRGEARPAVATGIGISDPQLGRIMAGSIPIHLNHVVALERHLGTELIQVLEPDQRQSDKTHRE